MPIIEIKNMKQFTDLVDNETRPIIIDFYADFCGPCKVISPFFEKFAESQVNQFVVFVKVDVEVANDVAELLGVTAMPTFMAIKDQKKISEFTGANKDRLIQMIKEITSFVP